MILIMSNRITITLSDSNKAILSDSANKFGLSKSDILNFLLKYAHYPKYSQSVVHTIHNNNLKLIKFNNLLNQIQLNYSGIANNFNQIAKALNVLIKHSPIAVNVKNANNSFHQLNNKKLILNKIYQMTIQLRKDVTTYDSKNNGLWS